MAEAASAHQAATASREETGQQRADRTQRTSADLQRAQQGATAAAAAAPAALDSLSRLQQLADASPRVAQLQRLQALANGRFAPVAQLAGGPEEEQLVQGKFASAELPAQLQQAPRANNTGLPDQLKSGIESLSGMSMDHVRVHYNSSQPAQLNALAYAQGSDIHLAPGQNRHLPHEAWHVVQQAQGRVSPTLQVAGTAVNDDVRLEAEADTMGQRALVTTSAPVSQRVASEHAMTTRGSTSTVQRVVYPNMGAMWGAVHPGYALANINADPVLTALYNDAAAQLPNCDFVQVNGTAPQVSSTPLAAQPFRIDWDTPAALGLDNDYFASAIIHELAHAASSQQFRRNRVNQQQFIWANLNLPAAVGPVNPDTGMAANQLASYQVQMRTIDENWTDLEAEAQADQVSGVLNILDYGHIHGRIQYALTTGFVHNDTVLGDMLYYLMAKNLTGSRTYAFARRMLKEANDRRSNGFWSQADTEARRVDSRAWWFQFWKW